MCAILCGSPTASRYWSMERSWPWARKIRSNLPIFLWFTNSLIDEVQGMEKKDFYKKLIAGTFFLTGIFLVSVIVLTIGIEKGLTKPSFEITVLYREVGGLAIGAPVGLSGVNVGTV